MWTGFIHKPIQVHGDCAAVGRDGIWPTISEQCFWLVYLAVNRNLWLIGLVLTLVVDVTISSAYGRKGA